MLPPVRIVCENGHKGSKHKDCEDAQSYLFSGNKKCWICGSKKLDYEEIID